MKIVKRIDITSILLAFFLLLIISLFSYLYSVDKNITNYERNNNDIIKLQSLDKDFNNFALTIDKFENYNVINAKMESFLNIFKSFQKNLLTMYPNDKYIKRELKKITKTFAQKKSNIEYFKSLNSSLINSSHFLFDLQRTIVENKNINLYSKSLINEALFYLIRYISSDYVGKKYITKKLEKIKKISQSKTLEHIDIFYKQTIVSLEIVNSLKITSQQILTSKLHNITKNLANTLKEKYTNDLMTEKIITLLFFASTIVLLISLIIMHIHALKSAKQLTQAASVYENTEEAIIIADENANVLSVNKAFQQIYGYKLQEIKGQQLKVLHSGKQNKDFYNNMWQRINEEGMYQGKLINKNRDGILIPIWITIKKIIDKNDKSVSYIAIQTDLREIESSHQKIDYLAYHDQLTGLYNRANFEEYLKHTLIVSKRADLNVAVLFLDLDRFKTINDTLGHGIGDKVLIAVAQRIKKVLRESDFVARWGGDEFVIILEDLSSIEDAGFVATNIIRVLQEPITIAHHQLTTTASIGIATFPQNGKDIQTILKHADTAMYLAKEQGKNNFKYFTEELSKETNRRLEISLALPNAIQNDELYMVFQPQYNLQTKRIVAVEALIRWENESFGLIPPDIFIPIAEENGSITKIGYFVFEESCKAFQSMKNSNPDIKYIAINVSSIQFSEPQLVHNFLNILSKYDLKADEIEIEITERFIVENVSKNLNILEAFRNYGFKISIDDFGTGYSSMSYLKQLPADTIKIDKAFIDGIENNSSDDDIIIQAIIALAHTLKYSIVAEGIETKAQEDFLSKNKCDIGQGYFYSKPITLKALLQKFSI